jgi:hypothetical protein
MSRNFANLLLIGGAFWIASELLEIAVGGLGLAPLVVTTVAFLGLGLGSFGLAQGSTSMLARAGAVGLGLGFLAFLVPVGALFTGSVESDADILVEGGVLAALLMAGMIVLLVGGICFGLHLVRHGDPHPKWTGGALIVLMLAALGANAGGAPAPVIHTVNMATALLFLFMGWRQRGF